MSLVADSEHAVDCLDRLQARLWERGDHSQDQDMASIMVMLDTPLFKQLLTLQDSLQELKQVSEIHPLTEENFMFGPSGELVLPTGEENGYPSQELSESGTLNLRQVYTGPGSAISTYSYNIEFQRAIDKAATGREVETIKLFKPENSSLGFSVVGLKREELGELGIYVQDINPGGIAAKDGRLREGDQILAIDGQPLDISHTEAIRILQNAQGLVEIVVARGPISGESEQVIGEEEVNVDGEEPIVKAEDRQEEALPPTGLDKSSDMVLSTEWTQIEVIDLINDGTGLGFGIIGGRSTGVVVKTILPGGVADVDTRLRSGDHILQIGEVNVRGMGSEQVALVLRQSGSNVRLIVARSVMEPPPFQIPHAPVVPTHLLDDHLDQINAIMAMDSQENLDMRMQEEQSIRNIMAGQVQVHPQPYDMNEVPEVEIFDVDLTKDNHGLGITIAGYVGGDNTPDEVSGIFVKGIADGSAAAVDGRVQVNDQIIEVDGLSLQGYSNHQAVEVLRKTGQLVHLKLVRYRHGPKYEKLQQYLAQANATLMGQPGLMSQNQESLAASNPTYDITTPNPQVDYNDVSFMSDEDYSGELLPDVEAAIKACWEPLIGSDFEVVVAQLSKFKEGGGLGISLEGTVDVENGVEVRPHHYIRSILPDGPVGLNGHLISADELLEVNGKRLLGLNHVEVVNILKDLPQHVRLVCARRKSQTTETYAHKDAQFLSSVFNTGVHTNFPASERLVKAKSEMALSSTDTAVLNSLNKSKSRSLEPLTNLAMWSSEPVVIELLKEDKGLGFSILDYQDPVNPNETVIVIRSLVPKGVAQLDGRLVPGDRLIFVNDINVEHATLDEAVQALKGAGKGVVRIGVAKPLPLSDNFRGDNQPPLLTAPALSDLPQTARGTNFTDQLADSTTITMLPQETTVNRSISSSSGEIGMKLGMQRKDSFYESDDEIKTPRKSSPKKASPIKSSPKEHSPPCYDQALGSVDTRVSYEHVESHVKRLEYESVEPVSSDITQEHFESVRSVKTHEAMAPLSREVMAPLPSYEEATLGVDMGVANAELFQFKDEDAPPVPPRTESHGAMDIAVDIVPESPDKHFELDSDQLSPESSPHNQSLNVSGEADIDGVPRRGPPPIPPKPRLQRPSPRPRATKKDDGPPPPLPITSPPTAAPPLTETPAYELESRLSPRVVVAHRKSESADSEVSSSSDLLTSSDLKGVSSPPSTPRSTASPGMSPLASPSLTRGWRTASTDAIPTSYEKNIKVQKGNDQLGLTVDAVDRGINGCVIKTIVDGGALAKDGRLAVGDYMVLVNNESMRRITNAQARAILRRASLLNRSISFTYIPSADVAAYQETLTNRSLECSPSHKPSMPSPSATLSSSPRRTLSAVSPPSSPSPAPSSPAEVVPVQLSTVQQMSPRQKSLASDGSPAAGNHAWGPARTVELVREPGRSLGISIVGGRVDLFHVSEEHTITGIFIKHVVENSPAGRNGTLKTGDRILEVNGVDVRDATHDEAVEIIRNATTPVTFVVQSLSDSACPGDLEAAELKSVQSFEEATAQSTAPLQTKPKDRLTHLRSESRGESVSDSESEDEFGYTTKKLQKKYGELSGDIHLVDLSTGSNGLGLSLAGNKDRNLMSAFVAGIQPESTAAKDGRITVGDELLEVNGQVLHGRSHLNASAIIKGIKTSAVKIVLLRRENYQLHMAIKPLRLGPIIHTEEHVESATSPKPTPNRAPVPTATGTTPHKEPPKEDPKPLDIVNTVTLQKGPQGLGFGIVEETRDGRHGIYVRSVTPGGAAAKDGQLTVGDQIMEVGDKSLNGVHYDKAIDVLRQSQGSVKLKVRKIGKGKPGDLIRLGNTVDESSTDPPAPVVTTDPKTCPITPGRETLIEIEKGRTGLGLSIVGGSDTLLGAIIIHEVYEDGAAFKDGRLGAGDQILEVNREDLRDATHDHAIQVLRQTPSNVWILMYRDDNQVKEEDIYDIFSVELMKKPGKGLGLSIVGKKTDVGVYISDIVKGGVAEADGRLMQGDQILAVNGEDMRNSTQEYAAGVLKTLMGKVTMMVGRLKAGSRTSSRRNSNSPGSALKKSESSASNRSRGKHSKNVSVDWTHLRNVELQHDESGSLGLSIAGGVGSPLGDVPIIVANLTPTGPAARCGRLRVGDKILMINNRSTDGMTHDEAVAVLKSTTPVMLQVIQGEELAVSVNGSRSRQVSTDMSNDPTATELTVSPADGQAPQCSTLILERGHEGLGFSIVGGHGSPHGDLPIYVKNVFEKGAAAENGGLKRGDQILAVNGKSLDGLTHDEAVNILKNARGKVTLSVLS
ncbi:multiple PDZ domain protein-like isoform X2 [Haliotis cracherodii]|uniref:multiple PDZ domain protein-like isoform X2 n=1 Tax=Haliotis cracherodii TaxID=6455 RepID=UPI0039EB1E91